MASLLLFRRDLRLHDNRALLAAAQAGEPTLAAFILDPALTGRWRQAEKRMEFLTGALLALDEALQKAGGRLHILPGEPAAVLGRLLEQGRFARVLVNRDYTPYALRRDAALARVAARQGVAFEAHGDQLLHEPEALLKADGRPYTVFTPYYRQASQAPVPKPAGQPQLAYLRLDSLQIDGPPQTKLTDARLDGEPQGLPPSWPFPPAPVALDLARQARLPDYGASKDFPALAGTARLSAQLRFGVCSVRQAYWQAKAQQAEPLPFLRQLHWRDFYHQIGFHFPHVYQGAYRPEYDGLEWDAAPERLALWQAGRTGFPLVDAGMRELAATGYMHGRARMVTAAFLTKNLHLHWRLGERHFARLLTDYDPAVNNGNWQWSAGTGCDAQPWFRIFNPWRQQRRFDPDCEYIKRWLPELRDHPPKAIHSLETAANFYLPQIADLKASAKEAKRRYRQAQARPRHHP